MELFEKISRSFKAKKEMKNLAKSLILNKGAARTVTRNLSLNSKKLTKDQEEIILKTILESATWLSSETTNAIRTHILKSKHNFEDKVKVTKILASIPYAEMHQDAHGKTITYIISNIWEVFKKSLGTWQLRNTHSRALGTSKKKFEKMIKEDKTGVKLVAKYLEHIGLHKPPKMIFAEYNAGINATLIYPLQCMLNKVRKILLADELQHKRLLKELEELMGKSKFQTLDLEKINALKREEKLEESLERNWPILDEDGIIGSKPTESNTYKAWIAFCSFLEIENTELEDGFKIVKHKVPKVKVKKNTKYFLRHIKRRNIRKALTVFANHVNVPKYAETAMKAYNQLPGL
jgi:hypothetical protein